MVITVDGPAAAGKSTVARALARRLGFRYLDTGAMYRAVTWKALREDVDLEDPRALARVAEEAEIELLPAKDGVRVRVDGRDVSREIRSSEVTENIHYLADEPLVRRELIEQQRDFAREHSVVAEGRDQGTVVFPNADVKFYLDASIEERARRRMEDLEGGGEDVPLEEVRRQIRERDQQDRSRPVGGLRRSEDMVRLDSTDMDVDEVVEQMAEEIDRRVGLPERVFDNPEN